MTSLFLNHYSSTTSAACSKASSLSPSMTSPMVQEMELLGSASSIRLAR